MGEKYPYQPLTRWDAITVLLYRTGIVSAAMIMVVGAFTLPYDGLPLLIFLHFAVGLSVFFIHLYIGRFKRALIGLYCLSLISLAVLLYIGGGDVAKAVVKSRAVILLLLPLSGCLGFITAKEAFCFRLTEGYLLAVIMPLYVVLVSSGMDYSGGLVLITVLLLMFTLRKVFQPLHYDIGDKSAYR